jgi:hypothetical protein
MCGKERSLQEGGLVGVAGKAVRGAFWDLKTRFLDPRQGKDLAIWAERQGVGKEEEKPVPTSLPDDNNPVTICQWII